MTLNELSRYYWARMNQASYMGSALECHEQRNGDLVLFCLLNWVYYMDIADEIQDAHGYMDMVIVEVEARGEFV